VKRTRPAIHSGLKPMLNVTAPPISDAHRIVAASFEELAAVVRASNGGKPETAVQALQTALDSLRDAERVIALQGQRIALLESLAMTDELTGLLNRRGFERQFAQEMARLQRGFGTGGLLILCDLDGFKPINDSHGHAAGDACLRTVGSALTAAVRKMDIVARLGGDEFAVLMPGATAAQTMTCIGKLSEALGKTPAVWGEARLDLRASFGAAAYAAGDRLADALSRADESLYADKHGKKTERRSA
jgi:diguanylate cyclase (GGDEF)-like protein